MDKNAITGLVLIGLILIGYSYLNKPSEEQLAEARRQKDSVELALMQEQIRVDNQKKDLTFSQEDSLESIPDSVRLLKNQEVYGAFSQASVGNPEFIVLENNVLKVVLSTLGGKPISVEVKGYTRYDGSPLILFKGDSTRLGLNFFSQNKVIQTDRLFFTPSDERRNIAVTSDSASVALRLYAGTDAYIEYEYSMKPDDYRVGFNIRMVNMKETLSGNTTGIDLNWNMFIPRQEKGMENENNYTSINFKYYQDDVEEFSTRKDIEEQNAKTQVSWIAFKQQFFSSVLMAETSFDNADIRSEKITGSTQFLKKYDATIGLTYNNNSESQIYPLAFYFGPNHYRTLKKYGDDLERLVPLGGALSRFISRYIIIPAFNFLHGFIANYGIIILLLTIFIKILLMPFTYKSYMSMGKMKILKPMVDEINERIPATKPMERQQATATLYKRAGVNPMGGCLPLLLQFPILFAMFKFFPSSIELRQQGFLWANDLSTYDSILSLPFTIPFYGDHVSLFTILMTVTTLISTKMSSASTDNSMPGMKAMMYVMPIMFMFLFNNFSAALTYYYFLTNVITIGQNYLFKGMIDEEKFLKEVQAAKAKPLKKSKFQERLELMAKESEKARRK
ncbi:MAG: membrane protein insertase YidC [Bacteroidales bacterium]|nr:membrane protein insertase YidC [Bacteroidales bacterium]